MDVLGFFVREYGGPTVPACEGGRDGRAERATARAPAEPNRGGASASEGSGGGRPVPFHRAKQCN